MRRWHVLIVLAGLMVAFPLASSASLNPNTWTGTWNTNIGKMFITGAGSGTYDFCDGTINGSVQGNKLTGRWTQKFPCGGASEASGQFEFTMADGGKSWTGRWHYASSESWRADWNGLSCAEGPCLKNGEEDDDDFTVRFAAAARHPENIASPFRRHLGWASGAAGSVRSVRLSYVDGDDLLEWAVNAEFKIVGKKLRTSGTVKTVTLDLQLTEMKGLFPDTKHTATRPRLCHEGMRARVVITNDNRVLPGGEAAHGQTRDSVVTNISNPQCDYLEHAFTNGDSHSHTPFVGGTSGSGGPGGRGGQWAIVIITAG